MSCNMNIKLVNQRIVSTVKTLLFGKCNSMQDPFSIVPGIYVTLVADRPYYQTVSVLFSDQALRFTFLCIVMLLLR